MEPIPTDDVDPRIILLRYKPVATATDEYVADQVKIEIGARSLREPCTKRSIKSILSEVFPNSPVEDPVFEVEVVVPERTFLEKAMLLHEEHLKAPEHRRYLRLSRHLYDLYRIKKSAHAAAALADKGLFDTIVTHRILFNAIRGISYEQHTLLAINFIPPEDIIDRWKQDYEQMAVMIFNDRPSFEELLKQMNALLEMFRQAGQVPASVPAQDDN